MDIPSIRAESRAAGGRHANERLRRHGMVPGVIYGHNTPPALVALSRHDLILALEHMKHVVQVDVESPGTNYLVKDVQFDHLQKEPIHVDLMRVSRDERVEVRVALVLKGEPKGIHEGGELVHLISDLEVECPLNEIPEVLYHNVKDLELGMTLHVKDLELPPDVKPLHEPDDVIALVRTRRGVTAEEAAAAVAAEGAAGTEPEVIARGKEEMEEDEGGA
jgi:large subunit ribosomal protein L25